MDRITGTYDGYMRGFKIITNATEDYANGEWYGLCFFHRDMALSCVGYMYNDTYTAYEELTYYDDYST